MKQLIYLTAKNKHYGSEKEKVCKPNAHDALKAIVGEVVRGGREVRGSKATTVAMSSSDWRRFFAEAGIPAAAAEQYATNFAENRISMDMLLELNKDYLRDLGIFVLGDIIAILRHAKAVQGKMTRSVTLAPNASSSVSASAAAVTTTAATTSTSVSTSPGAGQAAKKTHARIQVAMMHTALISCFPMISNLFVCNTPYLFSGPSGDSRLLLHFGSRCQARPGVILVFSHSKFGGPFFCCGQGRGLAVQIVV